MIGRSSPVDGLTVLTLERPEKANALTGPMLEALRDAIRAESAARCLVLTGAGRVFSAGADLEAARAGLATSPLWEEVSAAVADHPGLTIAALNGTAAGGALGMVLACDLRLAVPGAKVFYPVARLGFLPQPSDPQRMRALIGPARTRLILLGGARITAQEALAFGLVDRITEDPLAAAQEIAADALAADPAHIAAIKAMCD